MGLILDGRPLVQVHPPGHALSFADQAQAVEILERDLGVKCLTLTLGSGPRVRKALIPAAGFGTRLLPATKAQPKEMLPIVDRPAIQYVVEETVDAGLGDILIITGKGKQSEGLPVLKKEARDLLEGAAAPLIVAYVPELSSDGDYGSLLIQLRRLGL